MGSWRQPVRELQPWRDDNNLEAARWNEFSIGR